MSSTSSCYLRAHSLKVFANHQKVPVSEKSSQLRKCPSHPKYDADLICLHPDCPDSSHPFCEICSLRDHKNHEFQKFESFVSECRVKVDSLKEALTQAESARRKFEVGSKDLNGMECRIREYFTAKQSEALGQLADDARNKELFLKSSTANLKKALGILEGSEVNYNAKHKIKLHENKLKLDFEEVQVYCEGKVPALPKSVSFSPHPQPRVLPDRMKMPIQSGFF